MADRRENIIARFIATNTQRFKREVHGAARAVRDVGYEGSHASEELEVLKLISARLARQHETLIVIEDRLAAQLDDVGDNARQAGRGLAFLDFWSKRNARSSGLLGKRWSFWKDRLSLTAAEVKSTALTVGGYLSPALVELASSLGSALTGAGIVGGAGILSFIVGLGGIGIAGKTAVGQIKKIDVAQRALNVAIGQYGRGSKQAAQANAHLLGVIQANGGVQVWNAVRATNALKKAWTNRTGPARASLFDIISGGIGTGQRLLPTFARQTNLNAATARHSLTGAFSQLGGPEMRQNIVVFSRTFRQMFGPVVKGSVNLLFAFFRLMRVAAPYAVLWANAFLRWTQNVRRGSRDTAKLATFVSNSVDNFKAWWGLLKAVGRLLRTVFQGSNRQGQDLVTTLTNLVDRFNKWLGVIVGPNGQTRVSKFFTNFNHSLYLLFSDPQEFGRRAAVFFIQIAKSGFAKFVETWWSLDLSSKIFVLAFLFKGAIFSAMGRLAGALFIKAMVPRLVAAFAIDGAVGATMLSAIPAIGAAGGRAFVAAFLGSLGLPLVITYVLQKVGEKTHFNIHGNQSHGFLGSGINIDPSQILHPKKLFHFADPITGRAGGGNIPWGTSAIVGEAGPELMATGPSGPRITPMGFSPPGASGLRSQESILSVSDMLPPVHVHVNVARREIGKAVVDWQNDTKSRRGGRALDQ
jgi:hypothetical protein